MSTGSSAARFGRARAITDTNASRQPETQRTGSAGETPRHGIRWNRILWFFLLWMAGVVASGALAYALRSMLWLVEPH
jgi:hypothetical protein